MAGASRRPPRRWAPGSGVPPVHLVALLAYVGVLTAELPRLTEQLRANSDVAAVLLVGDGLTGGASLRPIEVGQPAYAWLVAALGRLGHETVVLSVLPLLVTWLGLAGVVLAVRRLAGGWAGSLALALGVGAAPAVLLTEVAPAFHGMAWATAGLLGWYAVSLASRGGDDGGPAPRRRTLAISAGAGVMAGVVAASDALVVVAGLVPFVLVAALLWVRTRRRAVLTHAGALIIGALLSFTVVHLLMARAGYSSGLGGGTTRGVGIGAVAANARVVGRGLLDMANGLPMEPGAGVSPLPLLLAIVLIGLALAGVCVVTARSTWQLQARPTQLARDAHVAYWVTSALVLLGALIVSNVIMPGADAPPADRLVSSQRYVTGVFFAVVALVPLWPRMRAGRVAATAAVTVFIAASAVRLVAAESNADFQPAASRSLPVLAGALRAHGLSRGYASYWDADVLRLSSGGALDVLPAAEGSPCGAGPTSFCRDLLNSAGGWFTTPAGRSFVVVDPGDTFIPAPPPAALGTPVQTFSVDRFTVFVYDGDVMTRFSASCAGRADHNCAG